MLPGSGFTKRVRTHMFFDFDGSKPGNDVAHENPRCFGQCRRAWKLKLKVSWLSWSLFFPEGISEKGSSNSGGLSNIFFSPSHLFPPCPFGPPKALWLVDCFYTGQSPDLRESLRQSPQASQGGATGDVWRSCAQVQKIAQEGGFPIPSCVKPQIFENHAFGKSGLGRMGEKSWPVGYVCLRCCCLQGCRGCSTVGLSKLSDEAGRFSAQSSPHLSCHHDKFAAPTPEEFGVCTLFGPACVCQGCSGEVSTPLSGCPALVRGDTNVVSTASWAPWCNGRPLAMTSMRRLSKRSTDGTFKSESNVWVVTLGPTSRHTLAAARSNASPRLPKTPDWAQAARWSPRRSLECDGIGRFELPTGVGGVDDEVTESENTNNCSLYSWQGWHGQNEM